jgi:hypothetical protein
VIFLWVSTYNVLFFFCVCQEMSLLSFSSYPQCKYWSSTPFFIYFCY